MADLTPVQRIWAINEALKCQSLNPTERYLLELWRDSGQEWAEAPGRREIFGSYIRTALLKASHEGLGQKWPENVEA